MKQALTVRNVVFALVVMVLIAAAPFSLQYAYQHGGFYLFSRRFIEDLPKRLTGPGRFRFVLQPAVAIFLGIRAGIADARARRVPYILSILSNSEGRRALLKGALEQLAVLIGVSILLDLVSQFLILHEVFPGPALIVGPVLIALPYSLTRAVTNRIVRRAGSREGPGALPVRKEGNDDAIDIAEQILLTHAPNRSVSDNSVRGLQQEDRNHYDDTRDHHAASSTTSRTTAGTRSSQ